MIREDGLLRSIKQNDIQPKYSPHLQDDVDGGWEFFSSSKLNVTFQAVREKISKTLLTMLARCVIIAPRGYILTRTEEI